MATVPHSDYIQHQCSFFVQTRIVMRTGLAYLVKHWKGFHGEEDQREILQGYYCGVNHTYVNCPMARRYVDLKQKSLV